MSYSKGRPIALADLNLYLDIARAVYGTGFGDRGYGQTDIVQPAVTGGLVTPAPWLNLRAMLAACAEHQGTPVPQLPPSAQIAPWRVVQAHADSNPFELAEYAQAIDANRLNADPYRMTTDDRLLAESALAEWSLSMHTTLLANFASEDSARFFFNTGGQLRFRLAHPNGATAADANWRTLSASVGSLAVRAHTTQATNTASSGNSFVGYYELADTDVTVWNGTNLGGGALDLTLAAKRLHRSGDTGGNGRAIAFTVTLNDRSGTTLAPGTQVLVDVSRSTTLGVPVPTLSIETSWTRTAS